MVPLMIPDNRIKIKLNKIHTTNTTILPITLHLNKIKPFYLLKYSIKDNHHMEVVIAVY